MGQVRRLSSASASGGIELASAAGSGVPMINLAAGWIAILVGLLGGTLIGLFFHREDWLGG